MALPLIDPATLRVTEPATAPADVAAILALGLPRLVMPSRDEVRLHHAIDSALRALVADITVIPEHHLSRTDRIDFFLPSVGLGIEVKVQESPMTVVRQLSRYAAHADVRHLLLVTTRHTHGPLSQLTDVDGVPFQVIRLMGSL